MKNKKRNTIITIVVLLIVLMIGGIFFVLNYSSEGNGLTILEKKWITDHTNKIVDVNVYNDIPIYGYNGSGIIFNFLDYVTDQYQIHFNKISYYTDSEKENSGISFLALGNDDFIDESDILLAEDHYVILSQKESAHVSLEQVDMIGILKTDSNLAKEYFEDDVKIVEYETIDAMMLGFKNEEIVYCILPNISYMDDILENDLHIVCHLEDLKRKFVLRISDETVYTIMQKAYREYADNHYGKDFGQNYLDVYFKSTNTSDLDRKNYNAKAYKYGYVINMPYENYINGQFVGTISNYLVNFEKQMDVEIEVVLYNSIDDLKSALVSGEIDFAFANFEYEKLNMDSVITSAISDLNYVVLSKDDIVINSIKGLKGNKVSVVGSSSLYHFAQNNGVDTNIFDNTDELLRGLDDQSIVLMDKETYLYYKDNKLKDYKIILESKIVDENKFLLNSKNKTFNALFSYYVSTLDYQEVRYQYHTDITLDKDYTVIKIVGFIVALIFFLVSSVILMNRKNVTNPVISKEEKLKYIDPMTSLKNRNYLNMNIYKWDDNVIFPQSVVVLDLNRIKEVNDTYGREAGDEVIKKVASILINHQLENTDIIRSGGDEFLIYMVGYDEKKVSDYTKTLLKEMKNIPNSLGVEVGYSMILDEVKTVDDAINEAIIMMTKNKEKRKAKE